MSEEIGEIMEDGVPTLEDDFWCQLLDWVSHDLTDKQVANVLRALSREADLKVTVSDYAGRVL